MPMRLALLLALLLVGCAHAPPSPRPARADGSVDARAAVREELGARLAHVERELAARAADEKAWEKLARRRLLLSLALLRLEEQPADETPPEADTLAARAAEELERAEPEPEPEPSEDEKVETKKGDGAGPKQSLGCDGGEPCTGAPAGAEPPAEGGELEEDDKPKLVEAARVLPRQDEPAARVAQLVDRHAARLSACVPRALRSGGVHLAVRVRIDARGRFREPRVLGGELDARVASCIADVFRAMKLDKSAGDSRVLEVPLFLPPAD